MGLYDGVTIVFINLFQVVMGLYVTGLYDRVTILFINLFQVVTGLYDSVAILFINLFQVVMGLYDGVPILFINLFQVVMGLYDGVTTKKSAFRLTFETVFNLDTNALEPVFDARFEFREFTYQPQTKLVFVVSMLGFVKTNKFLLFCVFFCH